MDLILFTDNIEEYLKEDDVVNYGNENIKRLADTLYQGTSDEVEYIKKAYEYVRDQISHSADIKEDAITCSASEVLEAGHGICFAKSHLLAALLRYKSIPTGFCYQKLILDDETAPVLIYHGFNGVYVKEFHKWIRLDARGNKESVNAQFSLEKEQLAFHVRVEKGEEDGFVIYPDPDVKVLEKFRILNLGISLKTIDITGLNGMHKCVSCPLPVSIVGKKGMHSQFKPCIPFHAPRRLRLR